MSFKDAKIMQKAQFKHHLKSVRMNFTRDIED